MLGPISFETKTTINILTRPHTARHVDKTHHPHPEVPRSLLETNSPNQAVTDFPAAPEGAHSCQLTVKLVGRPASWQRIDMSMRWRGRL